MIEDLDNPARVPSIHTIAAFTPDGIGAIPEGALTTDNSGIQFLTTRRGQARYVGPRPLPGHGTHRYPFHLYALNTTVDLAPIDSREQLLNAVDGHVLGRGTLTGTRRS